MLDKRSGSPRSVGIQRCNKDYEFSDGTVVQARSPELACGLASIFWEIPVEYPLGRAPGTGGGGGLPPVTTNLLDGSDNIVDGSINVIDG